MRRNQTPHLHERARWRQVDGLHSASLQLEVARRVHMPRTSKQTCSVMPSCDVACSCRGRGRRAHCANCNQARGCRRCDTLS